MGKLTRKRKAWVEEYLQSWNATEAARRVGFAHPNTQGPRLLLDVGIQQAITARLLELKMNPAEVIERISQGAKANIGDFYTTIGTGIIWDFEEIKRRGHLVKSISINKTGTKVEMVDGMTALGKIAEHLGLIGGSRFAIEDALARGQLISNVVVYIPDNGRERRAPAPQRND